MAQLGPLQVKGTVTGLTSEALLLYVCGEEEEVFEENTGAKLLVWSFLPWRKQRQSVKCAFSGRSLVFF